MSLFAVYMPSLVEGIATTNHAGAVFATKLRAITPDPNLDRARWFVFDLEPKERAAWMQLFCHERPRQSIIE